PNAYMLKEAAMGIVVLAKPVDTEVEYAMQDCAAATQNMLIAAKELGIGSCWIGCTPRMERVEKLRNIFPSIPQDVYPFWMIAFGYPKSDRGVKDKWDETKIHVETY
ncbi:MAG: nitroreductase family protein, partial [Erysipelotrichaceae bacterium]|nr:nitroreductase family protein [Erysipelotrichaceae bacterium]